MVDALAYNRGIGDADPPDELYDPDDPGMTDEELEQCDWLDEEPGEIERPDDLDAWLAAVATA